jgi:hypothetical protein
MDSQIGVLHLRWDVQRSHRRKACDVRFMSDIPDSVADERAIFRFDPVSTWSWHYRVFAGTTDEQPIADVSIESIRNRGRISIGDIEVDVMGKGWVSPRFTYRVRDREIASATTSTGFRTRYTLSSDGRVYTMQPRGFKSTFEIVEENEVVGEIRTSGTFSRRGTLTVRKGFPTHDALFLLFLAGYYWKMMAAAAS